MFIMIYCVIIDKLEEEEENKEDGDDGMQGKKRGREGEGGRLPKSKKIKIIQAKNALMHLHELKPGWSQYNYHIIWVSGCQNVLNLEESEKECF